MARPSTADLERRTWSRRSKRRPAPILRLLHAAAEQRNNWQILPFGDALRWSEIDEDFDVHGFLISGKAPDANPPGVEGRSIEIQVELGDSM